MQEEQLNVSEKEGVSFSNMKDMGYAIVHKLAMENDFDKLLMCLEEGVDPNTKGMMENTPLHLSILHKCTESFDLLMAYDANPNAKNRKEVTPFHYAVMTNSMEMVNKMLAKGADVLTPLRNGLLPHEFSEEINKNNDMAEHIELIYNMQSLRSRLSDKVIDQKSNVINVSFGR